MSKSRKVPEVIFQAQVDNLQPKLHWTNPGDLEKYLIEHAGEKLFVHIEPEAQVPPKMKMYAFLHRVIYPCAVIGYTAAGWEYIDNVKVDYMLRAEFAKDFIKAPNGEYVPIILDKRNMTMARLHKYISDCIFFIETELDMRVPDSEEYLIKQKTGKDIKKLK